MPLVETGAHMLLVLALAAPRMITIFMIVPIIGRNLVSGMVRTGIVIGMTMFLYPVIDIELRAVEVTTLLLVGIIVKEVLIGGLLALALGTLFWGVQAAGFFIDNHRGAAIAGSADPLQGTETSPLGITFQLFYTVYLFISGGFLALLGTIYHTYVLWPVLEFYPKLPPQIVDFALGLADQVMYLSLVLSGPVVIVMFLAEFGLAMVSRFAPQLNVFILAMPVKSGVGLFILVLYLPFLFIYFGDTVRDGGAGIVERIGRLIAG